MTEREHTGPHPIPALVQPERGSDPAPITKHGPSWKVVGAILGAALTVITALVGLSYQIGADDAAEAAERREAQAWRARVEAAVDAIAQRSQRHDLQIGEHASQIATLQRDVERASEAIEETKRRVASREN